MSYFAVKRFPSSRRERSLDVTSFLLAKLNYLLAPGKQHCAPVSFELQSLFIWLFGPFLPWSVFKKLLPCQVSTASCLQVPWSRATRFLKGFVWKQHRFFRIGTATVAFDVIRLAAVKGQAFTATSSAVLECLCLATCRTFSCFLCLLQPT